MVNKFVWRFFVCLLICVLLVGSSVAVNGNYSAVRVIEVEPPVLKSVVSGYSASNYKMVSVARGANDFAFKLGAELIKGVRNESFMFSPYAVWFLLSGMLNATNDGSVGALMDSLGVSGFSVNAVNDGALRMLSDLSGGEKQVDGTNYSPFKMLNAIFVDDKLTVRREFAQRFSSFYSGAVMNVDFNSSDMVDSLNQWASDSTDGLMGNFVQGFDKNAIAAAAGAIYYSDRWRWEFDEEQTQEGVFYALDGNVPAFFMIHEDEFMEYYEDDKLQAISLYFESGGSMCILLPKFCGAVELLSEMTIEYFDQIQTGFNPTEGKLLLPRFGIECNVNGLVEGLESLGVPLFDSSVAALTDGLVTERVPVWLLDVMQKAVIQVDERGTTAAAVTMLIPGGSMLEEQKPFEMICDKPFVFTLNESIEGVGEQVLFTGFVNRP